MSEQLFIRTLQALLTMVDPEDPMSVACMKNALESILAMAKASGKATPLTLRIMMMAVHQVGYLIRCRDNFAGEPGDFAGNEAKQHRLAAMLRPGC